MKKSNLELQQLEPRVTGEHIVNGIMLLFVGYLLGVLSGCVFYKYLQH